MKTSIAKLTALFVLVVFLAGCAGNKCYLQHRHNAQLNIFSLSDGTEIKLCKGGPQPGVYTVAPSSTYYPGSMTIYSYETNDRASRYDGSCEDNHLSRTEETSVPVALTTESFAVAKLCYHDSTKKSISLVMVGQACPAGTTEQTTPVDDCSTL